MIDEADGERPAGERAAEPFGERERGAAPNRGLDGVPIRLPHLAGNSRRCVGDARFAEQLAVALEAQPHRKLGAGLRMLFGRRHPAGTQRGEYLADRPEFFRCIAIRAVLFRRLVARFVTAFDSLGLTVVEPLRWLEWMGKSVVYWWPAGPMWPRWPNWRVRSTNVLAWTSSMGFSDAA